jgi:hypothetical protein
VRFRIVDELPERPPFGGRGVDPRYKELYDVILSETPDEGFLELTFDTKKEAQRARQWIGHRKGYAPYQRGFQVFVQRVEEEPEEEEPAEQHPQRRVLRPPR